MKSQADKAQRIAEAMKGFPATFGLRAFPGKTFRVSEQNSYINDSDDLTLYTQIKTGETTWDDFAKGGIAELHDEIVPDPNDMSLAARERRMGALIGVGTAPKAEELPTNQQATHECILIHVADELVIGALESADIGYWAAVPQGADHAELLKNEATAIVVESEGAHDGKGDGRHELTGDKVRNGLSIMATYKNQQFWSDLITENSDAWTGDALIQFALFGDLIYG